jgi:hypothetical protein
MQTELQLLLANFDLFGELSQVLNVSGIARNSLGRQSVKQPASLETFHEAIADNLSKAGWSWGCVSAVDSDGRTIWIADAHRDDGKRFVSEFGHFQSFRECAEIASHCVSHPQLHLANGRLRRAQAEQNIARPHAGRQHWLSLARDNTSRCR